MIKFSLILVYVLGAGVFASAEDVVQSISVNENSKVGSQKVVFLSDIANVTGFDSETLEQLKAIEITEAPKPGKKKHFSNIGFAQILRQKLASIEGASKVVLKIPSEVFISRKSSKLEASEVEADLLSELKLQCTSCEYEITSLALPIIKQDLSDSTYKINAKNLTTKGSFSVPLEVVSEDQSKKLFWLTGSVVVRKIVPIAKRNIENGDAIKEDDFSFEKKDITYLSDSVATAEDLKSAVASRPIIANQVISTPSIRKPSVIRVGETVKVFIGDESWQVSMDGVAQQNAYKGDIVKVKIPRTQKLMSGIATEKGMVEIR